MAPVLTDTELLRRLVAFDSTSSRPVLPIADFVAEYLDRPGIRLERFPCPEPGKVNLVATVGPDPDASGEGLVLSGHLDVVPAVEPEWTSDPFEMVETAEGFVGRGTADMKGFDALMLNAAVRAASGPGPRHPLVLLITCDEELGTVGARHLAEAWPDGRPLPRRAVIGEPTSLEVVRMHKGHGKLVVRTFGRSAHSGYPHLGRNAIETMGRVLAALGELRALLEAERGPNAEHFPEVPFVALNLATIRGGSAVNIVPDRCEVVVGFRVLPGMDADEVLARIRTAVAGAVPDAEHEIEALGASPPMLAPEDSDLHRTLCSWLGQEGSRSASYATDAGWIQTLGCECVLCGPGTIAVAHRPNEWIPRSEMEAGAVLLDRMVERWCRG